MPRGGILGGIGDFLFGEDPAEKPIQNQNALAQEAIRRSQAYGGMFDKDYGGSTADMMRKSQEAAQGVAQDQAQYSSIQAAKNAVRAARASGLNRGQAALSAGQSTGDVYGQTYNNALNAGMDRYQRGLSTLSNLATGNQDAAMSGTNAALTTAQGQNAMGWNTLGNLAGAGATLLASDKNFKEEKRPAFGSLDEALSAIKGFRYKYKDDAPTENAGKEELGVMAQDLEKVPEFKGAVIDTPEGKKVDAAQLTGTNTALIGELYLRIRELEKELGEKK